MFSGSASSFLRIGVTDADFQMDGTEHDNIDAFTIRVIVGSMSSTHILSSVVGIGSSLQKFEFPDIINFLTSASVAGLNDCSDDHSWSGSMTHS